MIALRFAHAERIILDFPIQPKSYPAVQWLAAAPTEWENAGSRRIDVPMSLADPTARFVATVVMEEMPGDSLRVWWEPDAPSLPTVPIGGSWEEGIRGWTVKNLLIPASIRGGGSLVLETTGSSRKIHRIILRRLKPGELFVPDGLSGQDFYRVEGEVLNGQDLRGDVWQMPPDAWNGNVIEAHLQEFTENSQGGVEFAVEISPAPREGVLRFEVNSKEMFAPEVWVNGKKLPHVSIEIPALRSPTVVLPRANGSPVFAGWRAAWAYIPPGLLVAGENRFLVHSGSSEAYVRRAKVEMWFSAPILPPVAEGVFPDVLGESMNCLPQAATGSGEPDLPAWDTAPMTSDSGGASPPAIPAALPSAPIPALETLPSAAEWFRTSLR